MKYDQADQFHVLKTFPLDAVNQ